MDKNSIHKSTSALIVLQRPGDSRRASLAERCPADRWTAAESREKARSAAAEEGCTNRTCFTEADLIYFCRKYTIFTKCYEFML